MSGGSNFSPYMGSPYVELIAPSNPAPGADLDHIIAQATRTKISHMNFKFVTDANPGNRLIKVGVIYAGTFITLGVGKYPQTANIPMNFYCSPHADVNITSGESFRFIHIPNVYTLLGGGSIATEIDGIQVGDQISNIFVYLERQPNPRFS